MGALTLPPSGPVYADAQIFILELPSLGRTQARETPSRGEKIQGRDIRPGY